MFCYSSQATGNITLFGESNSKYFTAGPTVSFPLDSLVPFPQNKDTAVFNIRSDLDIIVTVFIKISGTLSAYTAIPSTSLDKAYLVASYGLQEDLSELTVVATSFEGTTYILKDKAENITISVHQGNHTARSLYLGRGESVTYQTVNDFTGGQLRCSEPVVGVVESRCLSEGHVCAGHSIEHLFPLVALGTRYTAVPVDSGGQLSDIFRAVAVWDNTEITWQSRDSQSSNLTLNSSQTKDFSFKVPEFATIIGTKPFLLLHHVEKGNPVSDIALVYVPPHEQLTSKAITFSTYPKSPETGYPESYITIINPCKYDTLLQHVSSWLQSPSQSPLIQRNYGGMCGSSRHLDPGVYTLGPSTDDANALYSAILYTVTESGVAAHILATELNKVVCSVEQKSSSLEVHLCPVTVAPSKSPTISSRSPTISSSQPTTICTEIKNNASGTSTQLLFL